MYSKVVFVWILPSFSKHNLDYKSKHSFDWALANIIKCAVKMFPSFFFFFLLGKQMKPLSAQCLQPCRYTPTQWQCALSLKTFLAVKSLAPRTLTRRTRPSASSTPRRATAGKETATHTTSIKTNIKNLKLVDSVPPPQLIDINHYCNLALMWRIFSL